MSESSEPEIYDQPPDPEEHLRRTFNMQMFPFMLKIKRVRRVNPSKSTVDKLAKLLISPNKSIHQMETKVHTVLGLFFGWPACSTRVQAAIIKKHDEDKQQAHIKDRRCRALRNSIYLQKKVSAKAKAKAKAKAEAA